MTRAALPPDATARGFQATTEIAVGIGQTDVYWLGG